MLKKFLVLGVLLGSAAAFAQVKPSSVGGNATLWVGGEASYFDPNNSKIAVFDPALLGSSARILGPGVFFDFNPTNKWGVEGEARWLRYNGPSGETHSDYLGGVKYRVLRWRQFSLDAKFLAGGIWINYPSNIGSGSYLAYVPGGFVDYRLSRHFAVRGDFEYKIIPSAPGLYPDESNGLHPFGVSIGIAYRLLGQH